VHPDDIKPGYIYVSKRRHRRYVEAITALGNVVHCVPEERLRENRGRNFETLSEFAARMVARLEPPGPPEKGVDAA
jgi:hypothetical protein